MTRIPPHQRPVIDQDEPIVLEFPTLEEEVEIAKIKYICNYCGTEYDAFDWTGFGLSLRDWNQLDSMGESGDRDPWDVLDWDSHFCNAVCAGKWFLEFLAPRTNFQMDIRPPE